MQLNNYTRLFALACLLAFLTACSNNKTQDGLLVDDIIAAEMLTSDSYSDGDLEEGDEYDSGLLDSEGNYIGGNDLGTGATVLPDSLSSLDNLGSDAQSGSFNHSIALPAITTIYFGFDQSSIGSKFQDVLNGHAAYLINNPTARLTLEGHCDERGTREYNLALGERRGNAVLNYLALQGVKSSQLNVVSYGKEKPAMRGNSAEAYNANRRVELKY